MRISENEWGFALWWFNVTIEAMADFVRWFTYEKLWFSIAWWFNGDSWKYSGVLPYSSDLMRKSSLISYSNYIKLWRTIWMNFIMTSLSKTSHPSWWLGLGESSHYITLAGDDFSTIFRLVNYYPLVNKHRPWKSPIFNGN